MTLRARLILSISLVLLVSLAAGSVFVRSHSALNVRSELQAALASGGRLALNALAAADPAADQSHQLRLLVADFDGDRNVQATLFDDANKIVAQSTRKPPGTVAPGWFRRLIPVERQAVHLHFPAVGTGYTLRLETDAASELGEVWSDVTLAHQVLSLFCALVLAVIYWTLGRALKPLQDLTAAFARVGEGDYLARLSTGGASDVARLVQGFNRMTERLAGMEARNRRLSEQLAVVEEEERGELARNLHDEIGPLLFAADVDAANAERLLKRGRPIDAAARISTARGAIAAIRGEVRGMLGRLRSRPVDNLGLRAAIEDLVAFWRARRPDVDFTIVLPPESLGSTLDRGIYRIVQESLNNALRHGLPTSIEILVMRDAEGALLVRVSDDGGGLRRTHEAAGWGVIGMRERVQALGGSLSVENRARGNGVVVSAQLPPPDEAVERKVAAR